MAYAFEQHEPVSVAIPRIMNEQIVRAREHLTDTNLRPEKRVHEARKRFKETRALLRLVRKPLGEMFASENAWYRDIGRDLSAVRDADAVLEAVGKLELPSLVRTRVRRTLNKNRTHPPVEGLIANAEKQLVMAQSRIALWPRFDDSFDTLADGLRQNYRGGRLAMKDANAPDELHEWRKFAKTHWYHVQLLRNLWPAVMKAYGGALDDLSDALGDHHDLHVLGRSIDPPPQELLDAIAAKQKELEHEAAELGARIYAEKPNAWLARMRNTWSAWRRN
ncbi:MAG TPA: CHAD domain-containing protein [Thermoanaerobaculia bacterium]|nr:CHAD domain-containing protein [Thermoanaerobaculia bacterium]